MADFLGIRGPERREFETLALLANSDDRLATRFAEMTAVQQVLASILKAIARAKLPPKQAADMVAAVDHAMAGDLAAAERLAARLSEGR